MKKLIFLLIIPGAIAATIAVLVFSTKARLAAAKSFASLFPQLRGIRNNNPGNLVDSPGFDWQGQVGADDTGKAIFDTPENGIRAMGINALRKQQEGANTLRAFGLQWAPPSDNKGATDYGANLASKLGVDQDSPFDLFSADPFSLADLCKAITRNENTINPYPSSLFDQEGQVSIAYASNSAASAAA